MSDTDKCPKCGSAIRWELGTATCTRGGCFSAAKWLKTPDAQEVLQVMSHRIRELEARIAAKDEALRARPYPEEKPTEAGDYLCQFVAKSGTWLQVSEWALPNLYRDEACFLGEAKDKKITNWWPLPEVKK